MAPPIPDVSPEGKGSRAPLARALLMPRTLKTAQKSAPPLADAASPLTEILQDLLDRHHANRSGEVATYIPELAKADPEWFGICIATVDGAVHALGDSETPFTIQSISKPFAYGMALAHRGPKATHARVGVEPSGEAFNSISLEQGTGRPLNPMINAGAIAISSAIRSACGEAALDKMLAWFGAFAGRSLSIDDTVYRSESETGHRNRAIAHLLRNFGIVGDPVEAGLDLYFRQCSILVTCRDLAVLGATLANRGTNPITGERALAPDHVDDVLSVMTTCGMYDYAGQWLHEVGLPAKSGVAGGIVAVLPGRLGIGVFSPRLDTLGNSVRGIAVCRELSDRFRLHLFDAPRAGRATLRNQSTLARRQSTRVRPDADVARLRDAGAATHVLELQGDLGFAAMETIHRRAWAIAPKAETLVFDISRIDSADETAAEFFGALVSRLTTAGKRVAVAGLPPKNPLCRHLVSRCEPTAIYPALDAALEACEESILTGRPLSAAHPAPDGAIPLSGLEMAQGLDARSLAKLEGYLRQERFAAGQRLFAKGDEAQQIYFLSEGTVSVRLYTGPSTFQRLATFSAGSVFGEMAVVDRGRRSSDVWAETNVTSFTLSTKDYDRLGEEQPHIKFRLLEYLIRILSSRLRKANEQIAALSG